MDTANGEQKSWVMRFADGNEKAIPGGPSAGGYSHWGYRGSGQHGCCCMIKISSCEEIWNLLCLFGCRWLCVVVVVCSGESGGWRKRINGTYTEHLPRIILLSSVNYGEPTGPAAASRSSFLIWFSSFISVWSYRFAVTSWIVAEDRRWVRTHHHSHIAKTTHIYYCYGIVLICIIGRLSRGV